MTRLIKLHHNITGNEAYIGVVNALPSGTLITVVDGCDSSYTVSESVEQVVALVNSARHLAKEPVKLPVSFSYDTVKK